jgi:conjugative transfer signal peptidase TraF
MAPLPLFVVAAASLFMIMLLFGMNGYRINTSTSNSLGLWRIRPIERDVRIGDRVFICPPDNDVFRSAHRRGYLHVGICPGGFGPLIKTVVATAGHYVQIDGGITIDGQPLPHSQVLAFDGQDRPLTKFADGVVPQGFLFLHSDFPASYDSRYFGPLPAIGVLGIAEKVMTYDP